jgi:hypothetical protein
MLPPIRLVKSGGQIGTIHQGGVSKDDLVETVGALVHTGDVVGKSAAKFEVGGAQQQRRLLRVRIKQDVAAPFLEYFEMFPVNGLEGIMFHRPAFAGPRRLPRQPGRAHADVRSVCGKICAVNLRSPANKQKTAPVSWSGIGIEIYFTSSGCATFSPKRRRTISSSRPWPCASLRWRLARLRGARRVRDTASSSRRSGRRDDRISRNRGHRRVRRKCRV